MLLLYIFSIWWYLFILLLPSHFHRPLSRQPPSLCGCACEGAVHHPDYMNMLRGSERTARRWISGNPDLKRHSWAESQQCTAPAPNWPACISHTKTPFIFTRTNWKSNRQWNPPLSFLFFCCERVCPWALPKCYWQHNSVASCTWL